MLIIFLFIANDDNKPNSFDYFKKYYVIFFDPHPMFLFCFRSGLACKSCKMEKVTTRHDIGSVVELMKICDHRMESDKPCTATLSAIFRELLLG